MLIYTLCIIFALEIKTTKNLFNLKKIKIMKLPKYVFNNPSIMGVRFKNSVANVINLENSRKKHTGYAVYYSASEKLCGIFETKDQAEKQLAKILNFEDSPVDIIWSRN